VFKEHEGSFLVGMMAAMASKSGKVGFVGGMDVPLIRKFQCGYEQGAKYANPKIEISANMTGTTPTAWNDPARGGELAKAQFAKGVDVVFAAAGGTGVGVYQAAKDAGKLAIAAIMPTRKLPSCSLNTTDSTLGRSMTKSMIENLSFGNSLATFSMLEPCEKPTPMIGSALRSAIRRIACSRCVGLEISNSR
jgi:hypothetical protein